MISDSSFAPLLLLTRRVWSSACLRCGCNVSVLFLSSVQSVNFAPAQKILKRQKRKYTPVRRSWLAFHKVNTLLPISIFLVTFIYFTFDFHIVWFSLWWTRLNFLSSPNQSRLIWGSVCSSCDAARCFSPLFNLFFLFILKAFLVCFFSCSQTVAPPLEFLRKQAFVLFPFFPCLT